MGADDVRTGRDPREDPFLPSEAARHLDRLFVRDRLDVVDPRRVPVRHHHAGPALDQERAGLAAADRS